MSQRTKVAICGAGAWGTAMALHCERQDLHVVLVPRRAEQAASLQSQRENVDYLPGFRFGGGISVTSRLEAALEGADFVFMGAPSYALRSWCERIVETQALGTSDCVVVSLAKGLELETGKTPCEVIGSVLGGTRVACLSGPTFAGEVAAGKPTAMTLATEEREDAASKRLQSAISGPNLRVYSSHDLKGVELGGCMKNVYAVAAGCCQGLKLGDNALASLLTRAVAEMVRVGQALGARAETFYGLSGFGDLVATCHGDWSRNRTFGEAIAAGRAASAIIESQKTAVEGYRTARAFHQSCRDRGIDAPILEQVYQICYGNKPPMRALEDLMNRDLKREHGH